MGTLVSRETRLLQTPGEMDPSSEAYFRLRTALAHALTAETIGLHAYAYLHND